MTPAASPSPAHSPAQVPPTALARLFADERAFLWRAEPLAASADGVREFDDRLASVTPAAQQRAAGGRSAIPGAAARDRARRALRARPGELRPVRVHGLPARDAGTIPGVARADEQRQRLSRRRPLHGRARPSAFRDRLRALHRAALRRAALLRREHRQHAGRHARRLHAARGDPRRRLRGDRQRAVPGRGEDAAMAAVRELLAAGAGSRSARGSRPRPGPRLPAP